jgi:hypothetical protein
LREELTPLGGDEEEEEEENGESAVGRVRCINPPEVKTSLMRSVSGYGL